MSLKAFSETEIQHQLEKIEDENESDSINDQLRNPKVCNRHTTNQPETQTTTIGCEGKTHNGTQAFQNVNIFTSLESVVDNDEENNTPFQSQLYEQQPQQEMMLEKDESQLRFIQEQFIISRSDPLYQDLKQRIGCLQAFLNDVLVNINNPQCQFSVRLFCTYLDLHLPFFNNLSYQITRPCDLVGNQQQINPLQQSQISDHLPINSDRMKTDIDILINQFNEKLSIRQTESIFLQENNINGVRDIPQYPFRMAESHYSIQAQQQGISKQENNNDHSFENSQLVTSVSHLNINHLEQLQLNLIENESFIFNTGQSSPQIQLNEIINNQGEIEEINFLQEFESTTSLPGLFEESVIIYQRSKDLTN